MLVYGITWCLSDFSLSLSYFSLDLSLHFWFLFLSFSLSFYTELQFCNNWYQSSPSLAVSFGSFQVLYPSVPYLSVRFWASSSWHFWFRFCYFKRKKKKKNILPDNGYCNFSILFKKCVTMTSGYDDEG